MWSIFTLGFLLVGLFIATFWLSNYVFEQSTRFWVANDQFVELAEGIIKAKNWDHFQLLCMVLDNEYAKSLAAFKKAFDTGSKSALEKVFEIERTRISQKKDLFIAHIRRMRRYAGMLFLLVLGLMIVLLLIYATISKPLNRVIGFGFISGAAYLYLAYEVFSSIHKTLEEMKKFETPIGIGGVLRVFMASFQSIL